MRTSNRFLTVLSLAMAAFVFAKDALAQGATVEVENRLDRGLVVWVDGDPRGLVAAGARTTFEDVAAGPISLMASSDLDGVVATERRVLAPGETFVWTLYPIVTFGEEKGVGTLVVTNLLDRWVELSVAGNDIGSIGAGGTRAFPRLVAGDVSVEVRDEGGATMEAESLVIEPGEITRWVIGATERP